MKLNIPSHLPFVAWSRTALPLLLLPEDGPRTGFRNVYSVSRIQVYDAPSLPWAFGVLCLPCKLEFDVRRTVCCSWPSVSAAIRECRSSSPVLRKCSRTEKYARMTAILPSMTHARKLFSDHQSKPWPNLISAQVGAYKI